MATDQERDKNWERVLRTAIGFGKKYGRWPTRLLVDPGILRALERGFSEDEYSTLSDGVELVPTPDTLRAEADDEDHYNYGESLATRMTYTVSDPRPEWLTLNLIAAPPEEESAPPGEELEALVRAWHAAILSKDMDALQAIWAEDYAAVGPDGRVSTRSEELAAVRSPDLHFEVLAPDEVTTMPLGEVAVVRSRTTAVGSFQGEPMDASFRNTNVFVRRDGRWVAVSAHSTAIST